MGLPPTLSGGCGGKNWFAGVITMVGHPPKMWRSKVAESGPVEGHKGGGGAVNREREKGVVRPLVGTR